MVIDEAEHIIYRVSQHFCMRANLEFVITTDKTKETEVYFC